MKVIALTNFQYPVSLTVRNRIRSEAAKGRRVPMEDRGEWIEVVEGQELDAPADLLNSWLENGYAIEVPDGEEV